MRVRSWAIAGTFAALILAATGDLRAANLFEKNFWLSGPNYDANVPLCENGFMLFTAQWRFGEKESKFWRSDLKITAFEDVREIAFRPGHYAAIPRRYCEANALISDGSRHPIYYAIGEDLGMLGNWWGVQWCVVGLDRNWAYNPACKMARP